MELTTEQLLGSIMIRLFMMSKIQNLNGTHNYQANMGYADLVVYDVKDTKFEWNSQLLIGARRKSVVVYDVKDTKFEWNSQRMIYQLHIRKVVYDVKDTKFEWNSQRRAYGFEIKKGCL